MEPKSGNSFEHPSMPSEYGAFSPDVASPGVDRERRSEQAPIEREPKPFATTTVVAPSVALPTPMPVDPQSAQADDASMPDTAADEDLIEKEWVDKAKKIIASTKDDPYAREREVNKLQIDYLKKRYGKTLGSSE